MQVCNVMFDISRHIAILMDTTRSKSGIPLPSDIAVFLCSRFDGTIAGNTIPSGNTGNWLLLGLVVSPVALNRAINLPNQKEGISCPQPSRLRFRRSPSVSIQKTALRFFQTSWIAPEKIYMRFRLQPKKNPRSSIKCSKSITSSLFGLRCCALASNFNLAPGVGPGDFIPCWGA